MHRITSTLLWFLALACLYEVAWSVAGVPRVIGPVAALTAAIVIQFSIASRRQSSARPGAIPQARTQTEPA